MTNGNCAPSMSLEQYSEFTRPRSFGLLFTVQVMRYEEHTGSVIPAGEITAGGTTKARTIKQLHEQVTERLRGMIAVYGPGAYIEEEDLIDAVLEAEAREVARRKAEVAYTQQLRASGEVCIDYPHCDSHC